MNERTRPLLSFALLFPSIAFLAVMVVVPIVQTALLALAPDGAVSLASIERMLADAVFTDALRNTLLLLVVLAPVQVAIALPMALLVGSRVRVYGWLFYVFAIPLLVSDLAAGFVWLAVLTERGYLSSALESAGVIGQPVSFLTGDALWPIVVAEAWRGAAVAFVILLAGLRLIPRDVVETAELLGAGRLRRTVGVVLPLLRPSLASALLVRGIFAVQTFAIVFVLASGQVPVLAGETYIAHAADRDPSLAAAYVFLALALTAALMIVYLRVLLASPEGTGR